MPWCDCFDTLMSARFPRMEVLRAEPMSDHTTFRVGGPARRLVSPRNQTELTALLELMESENWPYLVIGNGSNLLVSDGGLDCVVICTRAMERLEKLDDTHIRSEAGVSLARLAMFAQKEGLAGLEFAHGIPGSLGGAVCMNAGAYGGEMCQVVSAVTAWFPGEGTRRLAAEELEFGYRHSLFSYHDGVVLSAEFALTQDDPEEIKARMEDLIRRRREKQPLEYPSAGSTFKRPAGNFAGALIEQCGLKGTRVGGAQVSEKHAGFLINTGGATCADVLGLIDRVQAAVKEQTGVVLEPEVKIVP